MWNRIITSQYDVEWLWMYFSESAHVSDVELNRQVTFDCFGLSAGKLPGRNIRSGNSISELGQSNTLGPDTAGAVQDAVNLRPKELANNTIQRGRLAHNAGFPILEHEFVVGRQLIVVSLDHGRLRCYAQQWVGRANSHRFTRGCVSLTRAAHNLTGTAVTWKKC